MDIASSVQSFDLYLKWTYNSVAMSVSQQTSFLAKYLGPALSQAGLHTKLFALDYQWQNIQDAEAILSNRSTRAYLSGVAWHCYAGDPAVMDRVHASYPSLKQEVTECSTGPYGLASLSAFEVALQSIQHWANSVLLWNIALDPSGGPKIGQGCERCVGLITVDPKQNTAQFTNEATQLGHFSKFVRPGALHIGAASRDTHGIEYVAFQNPDKTLVIVAHNSSSQTQLLTVQTSDRTNFSTKLPADAIATYTWPSAA